MQRRTREWLRKGKKVACTFQVDEVAFINSHWTLFHSLCCWRKKREREEEEREEDWNSEKVDGVSLWTPQCKWPTGAEEQVLLASLGWHRPARFLGCWIEQAIPSPTFPSFSFSPFHHRCQLPTEQLKWLLHCLPFSVQSRLSLALAFCNCLCRCTFYSLFVAHLQQMLAMIERERDVSGKAV